ncbi:hypothetical protein AB0M43_05770 [Longispora sp. NPDC051575]|uniref:hypothetical protein n=1 Tax=Longispora sp. NPDC051575 TaxID=3154943 RepID=UPI00342F5631
MAVRNARPRQPAPPLPPPPPVAPSGPRHVGLIFLAVLVLAATVIVGAVLVSRPEPATVRIAGSLGMFNDPEVRRVLAGHGLRVEQTEFGTRQIAENVDLSQYDIVVSASTVAAEHLESRLGRRTARYSPFASPMAVASYTRIVELLRRVGVAELQPDGTWVFDVSAYLRLVAAKTRWSQISGNTTYPNPNRVLLATTNPAYSNSAEMFVAIASHVLNGGEVIADEAAADRVLPQIAPCFAAQGNLPVKTADLFREFLVGRDLGPAVPMALVYENDFTAGRITDPGAMTNDMVLLYPRPNILPAHVFTPLTPVGEKLGRLLNSDPDLQRMARNRWGYRTNTGDYPADMAQHGLTVARTLTTVNPPKGHLLERLVDAIVPR